MKRMKRRDPPAVQYRAGLVATALALALALNPLDLLQAQEPPTPQGPITPDALIGTWQGELELPGGTALRIVLHMEADEAGGLSATADSPDQGVQGIPVEDVRFEGGELTLEMRTIGARFVGRPEADGTMKGDWIQGGQSLLLDLRHGDGEVAPPPRPQEPEPPFPYRSEDVRYPNPEAGIDLAGTLTLPEGDGPFPAVALVTGSGAQNRDAEVFGHRPFLVLADHLTRQGIAVLRSDDRGVGESEGDFAEATSRDFAGDAESAAAWLRDHPEIDPDAVGLVGLSEGGMIAPMVAAESDAVDFIVLMAPPGLPGEEILYRQGELIAEADGTPEDRIVWNRSVQERMFAVLKEEDDDDTRVARLEESLQEALEELDETQMEAMNLETRDARRGWIEGQVLAVDTPWFRFFLVHDPRPVLRQVEVPVLALFGELDLQVPPEANLPAVEEALAGSGSSDVTVRELEGLNHLFQGAETGAVSEYAEIEETVSPEVLEIVAGWIMERYR